MKKSAALLILVVLSASAFAQDVPRPLDPNSGAVIGGGSSPQTTPPTGPVPQPPTRRPDARPQPRPQPRYDECEVVMVDAYNRVVFRYTGLADMPSGLCRGPLTRCQQDIFSERIYGGLCYQTVR